MNILVEWAEGPTRRAMAMRLNTFLRKYANNCGDLSKAVRIRSLTIPAFAI